MIRLFVFTMVNLFMWMVMVFLLLMLGLIVGTSGLDAFFEKTDGFFRIYGVLTAIIGFLVAGWYGGDEL